MTALIPSLESIDEHITDLIHNELVFLINKISMHKNSLGIYRLLPHDWIIGKMKKILEGQDPE